MGSVLSPPKSLTPLAELAILDGRVPSDHEWRTWVVEGTAKFNDGFVNVTVPSGFMTDFASIPWIFRWWQTGSTGPQRVGAYFHDFMYSGTGRYSRREADKAFRDVMAMVGRGPRRWAQRWLMWAALRIGGWSAYRSGQKKYVANPSWRLLR